jgi:hypothetical protein
MQQQNFLYISEETHNTCLAMFVLQPSKNLVNPKINNKIVYFSIQKLSLYTCAKNAKTFAYFAQLNLSILFINCLVWTRRNFRIF